jgi:NADH-quinone oxidoreductase subunit D
MMTSFIRPGGLVRDVQPDVLADMGTFLETMPGYIDSYEALLTGNPIFKERTEGVGVLSGDEALALGVSGPALRASGVALDMRRSNPYCGYERYEFGVPTGTVGDCFDRYLVRMAEMRESVSISRQALSDVPTGAVQTSDRKVMPPPREELAKSMEAVIHHFKLWTEGIRPPAGEAYVGVESPRGELGFYIVSDGSGRPIRVHERAPSFANLQALPKLTEGGAVADVVACIASLDPIMGEVDR